MSSSILELKSEFELAGIVLGLAIFNRHILDLHFPPVLYKKLLNYPSSFDDLNDIYPEVVPSLTLTLLIFITNLII